MTDTCCIDLTLGPASPIVLNLTTTPIRLMPDASPIELTAEPQPIELNVTPAPIQLVMTGVGAQGPAGASLVFGSFVAAEAITSSSLTHVSPVDGLLYLADYTLGRWANSFTIAGCAAGATLTVDRSGLLYGLGGIVPGAEYWLGTAGQVRSTIPSTGITQKVGDGNSTTGLIVDLSENIVWG